jgi:hypothetical protein
LISSEIAGTRRSSVADSSQSNWLCGLLTHAGRAATKSQQERLAICPDSAVKNSPSVVRDDEKAVEHSEGKRRDGEQIHCRDGLPMIVQKRCPSFRRLRTPRRFPHPAQNSSFGDGETQHLQLPGDARCAPGGIFCDHAKDQVAQFLVDASSSRANPTPR